MTKMVMKLFPKIKHSFNIQKTNGSVPMFDFCYHNFVHFSPVMKKLLSPWLN